MIIVVAPYNGALPEMTQFLAGSKKIRTIIKALTLIDSRIILLNTGHQNNVNQGTIINQVDFDGQGLIDVITPPTKQNSNLGRLSNILNVPLIIDDIVSRYGVPDAAWFYNGYAFEMRSASYLSKRYKTRTVLAFEDWHFARNRGLNPKPYLDWLCWRLALKHLDSGSAVNSKLRDILVSFEIPTNLLPGIVTTSISDINKNFPPFKMDKVTIGYFGGLCEEKGADVLLRLAKNVDDNIHFIITGNGVLQPEFERLQKEMPKRFKFLGSVSEAALIAAMSQVDVIINAHHINDGVFPFKIIEALASGRLLMSTELPMRGHECFSEAIQFYDGNEAKLLSMVINARVLYEMKKMPIAMAAEMAEVKYGQAALVESLRESLM
jgi:glycosyltransferase involved in cell wall biosynthesis